jgi:hypothetical protein
VQRPPGGPAPSIVSLVAWPAGLTLLVTLLRLVGELKGWSPEYYSRLPGGGLAIVGIAWLAPLVGAWFGWRLVRAGLRYPPLVLLAGYPAAVLVLGLLLGYTLERALDPSWTNTLVLWAVLAVPTAGAAFLIWPALGRALLVYAYAARLPVVLVMALAIWRRWGTHYDAPPPGFPALTPLPRWLWTGLLPQTTIWIAFTLTVGLSAAAVGAWVASRRPR